MRDVKNPNVMVKHYLDSVHGRHLAGKEGNHEYIAKDFKKFKRYYDAKQFATESKEVVTELSKKTLGDYVKAAAQDAEQSGRDQEYHGHENDYKRGTKRQQGIAKAVDRLTKEETNLVDEVVNAIKEGRGF